MFEMVIPRCIMPIVAVEARERPTPCGTRKRIFEVEIHCVTSEVEPAIRAAVVVVPPKKVLPTKVTEAVPVVGTFVLAIELTKPLV